MNTQSWNWTDQDLAVHNSSELIIMVFIIFMTKFRQKQLCKNCIHLVYIVYTSDSKTVFCGIPEFREVVSRVPRGNTVQLPTNIATSLLPQEQLILYAASLTT